MGEVVAIGATKKVSASFMGRKFETDDLMDELLKRGALRLSVCVKQKNGFDRITATVLNSDDFVIAGFSLRDQDANGLRSVEYAREHALRMVNPRHVLGVEIDE